MTDARLLSFVERLERLQSEKDTISEDMKEVRKEAKNAGYDLPAIARLLKRRKLDREEQQEQDALDETYQAAIGMLAGTPLGEAAAPKVKPERGDGREPIGVAKAVKAFVDGIPEGSSVTIQSGGKSTTIAKDEGGKAIVTSGESAPPNKGPAEGLLEAKTALSKALDSVHAMMRGTAPATPA